MFTTLLLLKLYLNSDMCKKIKAYQGQLSVHTPYTQQADAMNNNKILVKLE